MKILHKSYSWLSSLLLVAMFAIAGTISAETVTFSAEELTKALKVEKEGVSITWGRVAPTFTPEDTSSFMAIILGPQPAQAKFEGSSYANESWTVGAPGTITKVELSCVYTNATYWGEFTTSEGTITKSEKDAKGTVTWEGSVDDALACQFVQNANILSITVEYTPATVEPEPVDPVVGNEVTIENLNSALYDHLNAGVNETPITIDGITITTDGKLNSKFGFQLLAGKYLTLAAPAGRKIVGVNFTANANFVNYVKGMSVSSGDALVQEGNNVVWTGEAESVTFTSAGNYTYLTGVVVTLNEEVVEPEPVDPVDPEQPTEMVEKTVTLDYAALSTGADVNGFTATVSNGINQAQYQGVIAPYYSLVTVTAPEGINMVGVKVVEVDYGQNNYPLYSMTFDSGNWSCTADDNYRSTTWTGKANKVVATTDKNNMTLIGSIIVTYEEPAPVVDPVEPEPDPEVEPVLVTKTATFDFTNEFVTEAEDIVCTSNGAAYTESMKAVSLTGAYSTPFANYIAFTAPEDATITKIEFLSNGYGYSPFGSFMKGQTYNDKFESNEWKRGGVSGAFTATWTGEANAMNFYNGGGVAYIKTVTVTYQYWEMPNEVIFNFKKGLVDEVEGVKLETEGNVEYSTLNNAMNVSGYNPPSTFTFVAPEGKYIEKIELLGPDVEFNESINLRYVERTVGKGEVEITNDYKTLTWTGKAPRVTFAATVHDAQIQRANVFYGDVEAWEGDLAVTVSDANDLEALIDEVTVTFDNNVEVSAAAGNVLGAVLDEAGNPVAVVYAAEGFDYFGAVEFDTNDAVVTFVKIADLKAELRAAAAASAARIAAFAPASNYAQVVFAPKSFLVDGKVYNKVICKEYTFGALTTGIESVATATNKAMYDLSGRRVMRATEGLYIVDGKKVIR